MKTINKFDSNENNKNEKNNKMDVSMFLEDINDNLNLSKNDTSTISFTNFQTPSFGIPEYIRNKDDLILGKLGFYYLNYIFENSNSTPMFVDSSDFRTTKSLILTKDLVIDAGKTYGVLVDPSFIESPLMLYNWTSGTIGPVEINSFFRTHLVNYQKFKVVCCTLKVKQMGILSANDGYGTIIEGAIVPSTFDVLTDGLNPLNANIDSRFKFDTIDGREGIFGYILGNPYADYRSNENDAFIHTASVYPPGTYNNSFPASTLFYTAGTVTFSRDGVSYPSITVGNLKGLQYNMDKMQAADTVFINNELRSSKMYIKISPPSQTVTFKITLKLAFEAVPNAKMINEIPMYQPPFNYSTQRIFTSINNNVNSFMPLSQFNKKFGIKDKVFAMSNSKYVVDELQKVDDEKLLHAVDNFEKNKKKIIDEEGLLYKQVPLVKEYKEFLHRPNTGKYTKKRVKIDVDRNPSIIANIRRELEYDKKRYKKPEFLDNKINDLEGEVRQKLSDVFGQVELVDIEDSFKNINLHDDEDEDLCYASNYARKERVISNIKEKVIKLLPRHVEDASLFLNMAVGDINYNSEFTRLLKTGSTPVPNKNYQYFPVILNNDTEVEPAIVCIKKGANANESTEFNIWDENDKEKTIKVYYNKDDTNDEENFVKLVTSCFKYVNSKYFDNFADAYSIRLFAPKKIAQNSYGPALLAAICGCPCGQFITGNIIPTDDSGYLKVDKVDEDAIKLKLRIASLECPLIILGLDEKRNNVGSYVVSGVRVKEFDNQNCFITANIDLFFIFLYLPARGKHATHTPWNEYKGYIARYLANKSVPDYSKFIFAKRTKDPNALKAIANEQKLEYPKTIITKYTVENWKPWVYTDKYALNYNELIRVSPQRFEELGIPFFKYNGTYYVYVPVGKNKMHNFKALFKVTSDKIIEENEKAGDVLSAVSNQDIVEAAKERLKAIDENSNTKLLEKEMEKFELLNKEVNEKILNVKRNQRVPSVNDEEIRLKDIQVSMGSSPFDKRKQMSDDLKIKVASFVTKNIEDLNNIESGSLTISSDQDVCKLIKALKGKTKIHKDKVNNLNTNFIKLIEHMVKNFDFKNILQVLYDIGLIQVKPNKTGYKEEEFNKIVKYLNDNISDVEDEEDNLISTTKKKKIEKEAKDNIKINDDDLLDDDEFLN